jgi:uncharacterized membrane protein
MTDYERICYVDMFIINVMGKEFNTTGFANLHIYSVYVNIMLWRNLIRIRYSTIATKEAARFGYNGLPFPHE